MNEDTQALREAWLAKATILTESLPYIRRYVGANLVIKFGGHAMGNPEYAKNFANDVVLLQQLGITPIIVHGGGPQIGNMLNRLSKKSDFIDGLRVTDQETLEIAEMVLAGSINKEIVGLIQAAGGRAVGISGKDGGLITARKLQRTVRDKGSSIERLSDLGFVGEPSHINIDLLVELGKSGFIPVIAPIGMCLDGQSYNINADTVAGTIAGAMQAKRLLMMTDVAGVLSKTGELIHELSLEEAESLKTNGTISGGMIPKVTTCLESVNAGTQAAVILDGRVPHAVLLELFTEFGVGTFIGKPE